MEGQPESNEYCIHQWQEVPANVSQGIIQARDIYFIDTANNNIKLLPLFKIICRVNFLFEGGGKEGEENRGEMDSTLGKGNGRRELKGGGKGGGDHKKVKVS